MRGRRSRAGAGGRPGQEKTTEVLAVVRLGKVGEGMKPAPEERRRSLELLRTDRPSDKKRKLLRLTALPPAIELSVFYVFRFLPTKNL